MSCVEHQGHGARALLAAGLLIALAGCASVTRPSPAAPTPLAATALPTPAPVVAQAKPAAPVVATVVAPISAEVQGQFQRALQAQRAGRLDEAERQWRALAQSQPELGGVHANLGLVHAQAGRHAEAVAALERAVLLSPTQPRFFNELGIAYRGNGQFEKAREAYERALTLDAHYAAALLNLGILHDLYLGNGAKALELYDRYLAQTQSADATVTKWATDLRRRTPATPAAPVSANALAVKSGKELQ